MTVHTAGGLQIDELRKQIGGNDVILEYRRSVDSTNEWARRAFLAGAEDVSVFLADYQSAGKGRRGRSWTSPEYTSVSMSVLLRPEVPAGSLSMLTLVMGMAAAEGMREAAGADVQIKWPNDVVSRGRKLCGILTEFVTGPGGRQAVIIGIGINVNVPSFPEELEDLATSLYLETGRLQNREKITAAILRAFQKLYLVFRQTGDMSALIDGYTALLATRDREVRVMDPAGAWEGTALGINTRGELLVRRADSGEVEKVYAGEVSVRGMLSYI